MAAQRSNLDRFWDRADVTRRGHRSAPGADAAGGALEPVPARPGDLARRGSGHPGQGADRRRLRRPLLLGHRDLGAAVPRLHPAAHRPQPAAVPPQHAATRRGSGPAELDLRGALFPWRTIGGDEASAYHLAGTAQFHLNADIAYAIRRYVDVRGDIDFLVETGAEILVETARMWMDLGFFGDDGCFHIHGVTGPDEYTAMVNDNAYTNLMARLNLRYAAAAVRRLEPSSPRRSPRLRLELTLDPSEPDEWERAAERDVRPARRRPRASPRRTPRSSRTSAGTSTDDAAGRSSRCSCTTTRSRCTGARCSSRPTW